MPQENFHALNLKALVEIKLELESDCERTSGCNMSNQWHIVCTVLGQSEDTTWRECGDRDLMINGDFLKSLLQLS